MSTSKSMWPLPFTTPINVEVAPPTLKHETETRSKSCCSNENVLQHEEPSFLSGDERNYVHYLYKGKQRTAAATNKDDENDDVDFKGRWFPNKNVARVRRFGALGISLSSHSDDDERFKRLVEDREQNGEMMSGESSRSTTLSTPSTRIIDSDVDTGEHKGDGCYKPQRSERKISDASFRGIVDALTSQNHSLRAKIRRYETRGIPKNLKKDKLIGLHFFDPFPNDKRKEFESFMADYMQKISSIVPKLQSSGLVSVTMSPSNESTEPTMDHGGYEPLKSMADFGTTSVPSASLPITSDRSLLRKHRLDSTREHLAGPSNSGPEPVSLSGTGSGMRVDNESIQFLSRQSKRAKVEACSNLLRLDDAPSAAAIVRVLEKLFEDTFQHCQKKNDVPTSIDFQKKDNEISERGSNEDYLGHLLDKNFFPSQGWTYLNLICTMGRIHTFNVTLPFVQIAIRILSRKLELSQDGGKVRWIGPSDELVLTSCGHNDNLNMPRVVLAANGLSAPALISRSTGAKTDDHLSTVLDIQTTTSDLSNSYFRNASSAATSILRLDSYDKRKCLSSPSPLHPLTPSTTVNQTQTVAFSQLVSGLATQSYPKQSASNKDMKGTQSVSFYSDSLFCSDLSRTVTSVLDDTIYNSDSVALLKQTVLGTDKWTDDLETMEKIVEGVRNFEGTLFGQERCLPVAPSEDNDDHLKLISGSWNEMEALCLFQEAPLSSSNFIHAAPHLDPNCSYCGTDGSENTFNPISLALTGMTPTRPEDCFTLSVKTFRQRRFKNGFERVSTPPKRRLGAETQRLLRGRAWKQNRVTNSFISTRVCSTVIRKYVPLVRQRRAIYSPSFPLTGSSSSSSSSCGGEILMSDDDDEKVSALIYPPCQSISLEGLWSHQSQDFVSYPSRRSMSIDTSDDDGGDSHGHHHKFEDDNTVDLQDSVTNKRSRNCLFLDHVDAHRRRAHRHDPPSSSHPSLLAPKQAAKKKLWGPIPIRRSSVNHVHLFEKQMAFSLEQRDTSNKKGGNKKGGEDNVE